MPRGPATKIKQFQKVLCLMLSGKPVSIEEIDSRLGSEIEMYRISSYILAIKYNGGVVRAIKNGRNVVAYQLMNVNEMLKYLKRVGMMNASVQKLQELEAKLIVNENEVIDDEHLLSTQ